MSVATRVFFILLAILTFVFLVVKARIRSSDAEDALAFGRIAPGDLEEFLSSEVKIVDLRLPGEIRGGADSFPDSLSIPATDLKAKIGDLDKNARYLLVYVTEPRSTWSARVMLERGFTDVNTIHGGLRAWYKYAARNKS